jgi:hypothetical protein
VSAIGSLVILDQEERADAEQPSVWAPMRSRVYRNLFITQLASNIGVMDAWRLYHSVEQPDTFLERFTVTSWTEFERQRTERWLDYDHDGVAKAISYTVDRDRQHEYYLALRLRG